MITYLILGICVIYIIFGVLSLLGHVKELDRI